FRSLVPRFAIPARLRAQFPGGMIAAALTLGGLVVALVAPAVAQYQCLFEEILLWEYTVTHEFTRDGAGRPISRYVDRLRRPWPFGLQDDAVRQKHREPQARVIYVH